MPASTDISEYPADRGSDRAALESADHDVPKSPASEVSSGGNTGQENDSPTSLKPKALLMARAKEIMSTVTSRSSESSSVEPQRKRRPWRATLIRFGPLSGIFSMFLAIASIFAALGILAGSDGQPVSRWSVPPSTYLAIFTAIANLSMRYAAIQGVIIAWWAKACRGSTIGALHWDWRSGTTVLGAVTAGRHMGLLGLACIVSTLVVVDGPLIQRSSFPRTGQVSKDQMTLQVSMAPEIPTWYTGFYNTAEQIGYGDSSPAFNSTIPGNNGTVSNKIWSFGSYFYNDISEKWFNDRPIGGAIKGCKDQCKAKILAPAVVPTVCTSHTTPVNYDAPLDAPAVIARKIAAPMSHNGFVIDIALTFEGDREKLNLFTGYATVSSCQGTLNYEICTLESGIGEYDVLIQNNEIMLDSLQMPTILAVANNTAANRTLDPVNKAYRSTLAGATNMMNLRWNTLLTYFKADGVINSFALASQPIEAFIKLKSGENCPSFKDPRDMVLLSFNKLMMISGANAARDNTFPVAQSLDPGWQIDTTVVGVLDGNQSIFQTNYWYFLGAALLEIVCIALVVPTYWGWWKIGRPMSFSPLEMAKAFESPMFENHNSNSTGRDLANASGEVRVKYGLLAAGSDGEKSKIAFGGSDLVKPPEKGMRFDL